MHLLLSYENVFLKGTINPGNVVIWWACPSQVFLAPTTSLLLICHFTEFSCSSLPGFCPFNAVLLSSSFSLQKFQYISTPKRKFTSAKMMHDNWDLIQIRMFYNNLSKKQNKKTTLEKAKNYLFFMVYFSHSLCHPTNHAYCHAKSFLEGPCRTKKSPFCPFFPPSPDNVSAHCCLSMPSPCTDWKLCVHVINFKWRSQKIGSSGQLHHLNYFTFLTRSSHCNIFIWK